ncbi:hypothetical protein PBY51_002741 [Eleginops maclovinus]|uniref:Uncharacterized protein n=1 Tax=Eleginops maclovinus TaxID=56733 RepID=A0AAN8AJN1_ELEMC|nr:hypothetical protein PBY51_002741 [Eleginops maclovinus]
MKLQILLALFLRETLGESHRTVIGYIGENVTLSSGANPKWTLSIIEWTIYTNNTWIATLNNGLLKVEWVDRYKGRLTLNSSSGDLMIHGLTSEDAMQYNVDLTNTEQQNIAYKVDLLLKQRLKKPTLERTLLSAAKEGCQWQLNCSSADKVDRFVWHAETPYMTFNNGSYTVLLTFLNSTQSQVEFKCTSFRKSENASEVDTLECDYKPARDHNLALFTGGSALGVFLVFLLMISQTAQQQRTGLALAEDALTA